jgi:hypothetical protein
MHTISCERCHLQLLRRICKGVEGWWRESKRDGDEMGRVGGELRGSGTLKHACIPMSVEIPSSCHCVNPIVFVPLWFVFRPRTYLPCLVLHIWSRSRQLAMCLQCIISVLPRQQLMALFFHPSDLGTRTITNISASKCFCVLFNVKQTDVSNQIQ